MSARLSARILSKLMLVASVLLASHSVFAQSPSLFTQTEMVETSGGFRAYCGPVYTTPKSSCSGDWVDNSGNPMGGIAIAVAGYGTLRAYVYGYVIADVAESGTTVSSANATAGSNDYLSFVGLSEPAYVWLQGNLAYHPRGTDTLGWAQYVISVPGSPDCVINNLTPQNCTIQIPVTPGESLFMQRSLNATANASITDYPANTYVYIAVILGYQQPGGATLKVTVKDAKGHRIKGVTVVGASGHIYK